MGNEDILAFVIPKKIEDLPLAQSPNLVGNFVVEEKKKAKRLPADTLMKIINTGISGDLDKVTAAEIPTSGYYKYDIFSEKTYTNVTPNITVEPGELDNYVLYGVVMNGVAYKAKSPKTKSTDSYLPIWSNKSWNKGFQVQHPDSNGLTYISLVDNNTSTPGTDDTKWLPVGGVDDKVENFPYPYPNNILYAHYNGSYTENGAYLSTGYIRGFKKGDIIKYGSKNRRDYPTEGNTTGRTMLALFDEVSLQRIKNIVVDTDVALNSFVEGEIVLDQDCIIYFATATSSVSDAVGAPYLHRVSYKTLTTQRKDISNGYVDFNAFSEKVEYIFPMQLNRYGGLTSHPDDFRSMNNFRCTDKTPLKTGDKVKAKIKTAPAKIANTPVLYVMFYHSDKDDPNKNKIGDIILMEKNNYGQFIDFEFTAYRDGYICIASDLGTSEERKTWFPHVSILRKSELLKQDDINTIIAGKDYVNKSLVNQFSIGLNHVIDSHKLNNNQHVRYDHLTYTSFKGAMAVTLQRSEQAGGDYNGRTKIVTYLSHDNGATFNIFKVKPFGTEPGVVAEGNPLSLLNNDGTLTILFVKQIGGSQLRSYYMTVMDKDGNYTTDVKFKTAEYASAFGGSNSLRIGDETFFTIYEETGFNAPSWIKLYKYNHETKVITDLNVQVSTSGTPSESGIYELPNGDWCLYCRNTQNYANSFISKDKGLTWSDATDLLRAPDSMLAIKRLAARNSLLQPIYIAVVNEWMNPSDGNSFTGRRWQTVQVSVDGVNFYKMGNITRYTGEYFFFEPHIYETGDAVHVGWSTMPKDIGGGELPGTTWGSAWNCVIEKRKIQDFTNAYLFDYSNTPI